MTTTQVSATMMTPLDFERLPMPVPLEKPQHVPAGARVDRHRQPSAIQTQPQRVEFLERQMRAADRDGVDAIGALGRRQPALRIAHHRQSVTDDALDPAERC